MHLIVSQTGGLIMAKIREFVKCYSEHAYSQTVIYNLQRLMLWQLIREKAYISCTMLYGCAATGFCFQIVLSPATCCLRSPLHLLWTSLILKPVCLFSALIVCTSLPVRINPRFIYLQQRIIHLNWKKKVIVSINQFPIFSRTGVRKEEDHVFTSPIASNTPNTSVISNCTTRLWSRRGLFHLFCFICFKDDATQFSIICRSLK